MIIVGNLGNQVCLIKQIIPKPTKRLIGDSDAQVVPKTSKPTTALSSEKEKFDSSISVGEVFSDSLVENGMRSKLNKSVCRCQGIQYYRQGCHNNSTKKKDPLCHWQ